MSRFKGVSEQIINDVRAGWRQIVREMGGVDRTSKVCSVAISQVSIYGSLQGDSLPSLATVLAAETDLGKAHVTEALARATGHILVPIKPLAQGDLSAHLARVGGETGEVFNRYAAALSNDGKVDAEERREIARELQDLIQAATAALGHLQVQPAQVVGTRETASV
ncbi:phage regulatory CII family protein [Roseomonas xinghualingensis]|uniref:phage regulatory CII family protein n=1 Tax=Roseomonas xinghualingensis TaxID=2986475 RepID=UPI0021F199AE|nr:phage regulatory CII family protein [Roseomonas sp. SXEYE001]MCV4209359.1 hypothetical protein [Roseomonas sp. SXEYE001]